MQAEQAPEFLGIAAAFCDPLKEFQIYCRPQSLRCPEACRNLY